MFFVSFGVISAPAGAAPPTGAAPPAGAASETASEGGTIEDERKRALTLARAESEASLSSSFGTDAGVLVDHLLDVAPMAATCCCSSCRCSFKEPALAWLLGASASPPA